MNREIYFIFQKDFRAAMSSFPSFLLFAVFLMVSGFFFSTSVLLFNAVSNQMGIVSAVSYRASLTQIVIEPFFNHLVMILIFIIPLLTMRSFAEEKKSGTYELLCSYPVSHVDIVAGKFAALFSSAILLLIPTTSFFILFQWLRGTIEIPVIVVSYAGVILTMLLFTSMGMFFSSLTESQWVSSILSFFSFIILWAFGWVSDWISPELFHWVKELWIIEHIRDSALGIMDTNYVALYLIGAIFFFLMTILSIETRTWKR